MNNTIEVVKELKNIRKNSLKMQKIDFSPIRHEEGGDKNDPLNKNYFLKEILKNVEMNYLSFSYFLDLKNWKILLFCLQLVKTF